MGPAAPALLLICIRHALGLPSRAPSLCVLTWALRDSRGENSGEIGQKRDV